MTLRSEQPLADDSGRKPSAAGTSRTLAAELRNGRSSPSRALAIGLALGAALREIHASGRIHGDLHPESILLSESLDVRLLEPSQARSAPTGVRSPIRPAERQDALPYIAPEQSGMTDREVDYRSDYYALGAILFEVVTGRPPFRTSDPLQTIHAHLATKPELAHTVAPGVPVQISRIIDKLLSKDPDRRYQSAFGLRSDLELCAKSLAETGSIPEFSPGDFDAPERFRLPMGIYGRDRERTELLAALSRVSQGRPELVLVAGAEGSGKTALVNELQVPVARARGMFVAGKFEEIGKSVAYAAIRQVLHLVSRALMTTSEAELKEWQRVLHQSLANNGKILLDLAPELEAVIGIQPALVNLAFSKSKARFDRTMQAFFSTLSKDAPVVIFLDDLQWSDPASRDLMVQIGSASGAKLLLVGAYRSDETDENHPLWKTVRSFSQAQIPVSRIEVASLLPGDLAEMVRDTFGRRSARGDADALALLIHQKSNGNPFFSRLLLTRLHEDGLFLREASGRWTWDLEKIEAQRITENVVDLVVQRARELEQAELHAVEIGACIGTEFQVTTVAHALGIDPSLAQRLLAAGASAGLIREAVLEGPGVMQFVHDRVRRSIYANIGTNDRGAAHLSVARALRAEMASGSPHSIFNVVTQFNQVHDLLSDDDERNWVAALNLSAGQTAKSSGAYAAALDYFAAGVALAGEGGWTRNHAMTYALRLGSAECESREGIAGSFEPIAQVLDARAASPLERAQLTLVRLTRLASSGAYREAVEAGISALAHLGFHLPDVGDDVGIAKAWDAALERHRQKWQGRPIAEHADLPANQDPVMVTATAILCALVDSALIGAPTYLPLLTATMVDLFVEHGNTPLSAMGYVSHATVLSNMQDFEQAYEFGRMALRLNEIRPELSVTSKLLNMFGSFVQQFREPFHERLAVFGRGIRAGLDSGDLLFACYNTVNLTRGELFAGRNLADFLRDRGDVEAKLAVLKNPVMFDFAQMFFAFANNLAGASGISDSLDSGAFQEAGYYATYGAIPVLASHLHTYRMRAHYLHGRFERAREIIAQVAVASIGGQVEWEHFHFIAALALLEGTRDLAENDELETYCAFVERVATACPENFGSHAAMLSAEKARRKGELLSAGDAFDSAIALADRQSLPHDAGLAAELAARMWLAGKRPTLARPYAEIAVARYQTWGADRIVERIEREYAVCLNRGERKESQSNSPAADNLDVLSLVKAAGALSSEIRLEALIERLMLTVLQIGGAERAVLIFNEQNKLLVVGQCSGEHGELVDRVPIGLFAGVTEPLVQLAARARKPVVVHDAQREFAQCDYVLQTGQTSLFAAPLIKQGELVGVLYLENKLAPGAFTPGREQVLELVASQLAVAIENARLYEVVIERVRKEMKNREAMEVELRQAQKLEAVGRLAAGVAHEINTPVQYVADSVRFAQDATADILLLLEKFHQANESSREGARSIEVAAELAMAEQEADLPYLRENLPTSLARAIDGLNRIAVIVRSMKQFAHADGEGVSAVDVNDVITSTLIVATHEYKLVADVETSLEPLPPVMCHRGELGQVILNIIVNATHAIETVVGRSGARGRITVRTRMDGGDALISITDTGTGIPEEVRERIFDPFFTTKEVGKGTGQGLPIVRSIVEKYGGRITFESRMGEGTTFFVRLPLGREGTVGVLSQ